MTEVISDNERKLLRMTLDVVRAVEERMKPLRSVFIEGEDIDIIDVKEPFYQIARYYGIPYETSEYCRDSLDDAYGHFLDGKITPDEFIDKVAADVELLKWLVTGEEAQE